MTISGATIETGRRGVPPFLIDASLMVGQPSTRCVQQLWCSQQALRPAAPVGTESDESCATMCRRELRLPTGFTPLID
jgi:hypothetical protein